MKNRDRWRRIFGWQVGDYLKYYFISSGKIKGIWLTLRITKMYSDFVEVKVLNKNIGGLDTFNLRIDYVQKEFPKHLRSYTPRKNTVRRFEGENR